MNELVVVPGHGVCLSRLAGPERVARVESWGSVRPGEASLLVEHIREGVRTAAAQPLALLVFSGGETDTHVPGRAEADGYFEIAASHGWWGYPEVSHRCECERYARDSAENLLFSVAVFAARVGALPAAVTIIGWRFKTARFTAHDGGLGLDHRFEYRGVNDSPPAALSSAVEGEARKQREAARDPLLLGSEWVEQRRTRNPFGQVHPYRGMDPRLDALFDLYGGAGS